jgi:hypothetical protein
MHVEESTIESGVTLSRVRDFTATQRAQTVVNSAMGFEYAVSPLISVLGGVATDFSSADRLAPQDLPAIGLFSEERVHRTTVSGGIGSHGKTAEVLFGAQLGYGWGKAYALNSLVVPNQLAVVDLRTYSGILIIAGSADLRAIGEMAKGVEQVVVPHKPGPRP